MKELNIWDKVYIAIYQYTEYIETCTVCFWKKKVQVILWNDDIVELDCNACNESYWPPRGFIEVRDYKDNIQLVTISWKDIRENQNWRYIDYNYNNGNYVLTDGNYFETREEAEIRLKEIIENTKKEDNARYETNRKWKLMSLSWSIRYHTKEAKDCEKNMNRHLEKVKYIKTITK